MGAKSRVRKGKAGNPNGNPENLKRFGYERPVPTAEELAEAGRRGGVASGQSRRRTKELDKVFMSTMNKAVNGRLKDMLVQAGYEEDELVNSAAVFATLVAMAVNGDLKASEILLDYSLSIQEEQRKKLESKARIESLRANSMSSVAVSSTDDDDGGVMIYLPAIEEDDEEGAESAQEGNAPEDEE